MRYELLPALLLNEVQRQAKENQRQADQIRILTVQAERKDEQIASQQKQIDALRSLPGVGKIVAATIIAEACTALTERDYRALRGHAGIAPVTKQSGKQRMVLMRYACNGRLRHAFYHCARVAVIRDLPSKSYYTALRRRGHTRGRSLHAVADRLLRILIAMLTTRTLFDCSKARTRGIETLSEKVA